MRKRRESRETVSEISVDPQPGGLTAVYLVATRSEYEAEAVKGLFAEVAERLQMRKLCDGKLVSFVVQAEQCDAELLDVLEDVLKRECEHVLTQRSFDEVIHRVVRDLARDTKSELIEVPTCNICGRTDPFPRTVLSMADGDGMLVESRCYCGRCTAEASPRSNKEFVLSLLEADEADLGAFAKAELVRRRSAERSLRFRIDR